MYTSRWILLSCVENCAALKTGYRVRCALPYRWYWTIYSIKWVDSHFCELQISKKWELHFCEVEVHRNEILRLAVASQFWLVQEADRQTNLISISIYGYGWSSDSITPLASTTPIKTKEHHRTKISYAEILVHILVHYGDVRYLLP